MESWVKPIGYDLYQANQPAGANLKIWSDTYLYCHPLHFMPASSMLIRQDIKLSLEHIFYDKVIVF